MAQKNNVEVYKNLKTDLEARIVYEDLDGECFMKTEDGMEFIVLISMPDDSGCWYEDNRGDEQSIEINQIYLNSERYNRMLEIKQRKGW